MVALRAVPRLQTRAVHGHERAFVMTGRGPALLLVHGLGCDHTTWLPVIPRLARRFTVIAPDLLGHGGSAKPRADYSVGGFANGMRDLLGVLEIERATVVGHSFGGGVAMQFAYQFPERTERLGLVSPGGLGQDVSLFLRALTLPGAGLALGAATLPPNRLAARLALGGLADLGLPGTRDLRSALRVLESMGDPAARSAFLHVLRAIVDWRGQVITMLDRAYLTRAMPTLVVWGADDTVIPSRHAQNARSVMPGSRVEVVPAAGHFPHEDAPDEFVAALVDFVRTTRPARHDKRRWRALLREGGPSGAGAHGLPERSA